MKKRVYTVFDSFTGKEITDHEEVKLSVGNKTWTLDLSKDSHQKLLNAIQPFVKNEKPTFKFSNVERAELMEFAKKNKLGEVNTRGPIPENIIEAWTNR